MAPKKATAKAKPKVAAVKSKAEKAKAAKDKEPKAILDVTQPGTDMVQRKDISAFVTGLKYKATNGKSEDAVLAQQLLQDTKSSCIMQGTLVMHVRRDMYSLVAMLLPIHVYVSPCQNYHTMKEIFGCHLHETGWHQAAGLVANYFANSSTTSKEKHVAEKGFFTGPEILQFQGFQVGMNIPPRKS